MALIAMAVYSTIENGKDEYLAKTLKSLFKTVDFNKHRLMLSVNAYTDQTKHLLHIYSDIISDIIYNDHNIGTAEAINLLWRKRLRMNMLLKWMTISLLSKKDGLIN